ncbi:hypothetical protein M408DRAFT_29729 [Serendipita vermifera MAFF 305830]|uniref:Alcohol dehydrogenase-like N-terminal domain-containing protein n=1 Tax=Serendipita vermifera MAFF 305830 TaxID=933852 RepID=A0A0C3APR5_SERVB|nr:hypothetical protein M408DRAFT_29729 [Serendipita vermifera MAFF 305830]
MRALTWQGKYDVRMSDSFKPRLISDQDVIVKVTGSSVCGTDLHLYHGTVLQMQKDDILGHEFCGKVDSVGRAVKTLKPGDRVVASACIACGDCYYCKQKLTSVCENSNIDEVQNYLYGHRTAGVLGLSHLNGGFAGGQAEYVRMPYGDTTLLKVPDDVPDEKALFLSDVLCTAYHAVVRVDVQKGDTVAIWGLGPVGLLAACFAFQKGASRVIGIDNNWRLEYGKSRLPKLETINFSDIPSGSSVSTELRKMVDKGVDRAIDCAAGEYPKGIGHKVEIGMGLENDTSEIVNEMILSAKKFGTVGVVSVYTGYTNHFNIGAIMELGIRFIGVGVVPVQVYWEELLQQIQAGTLDPTIILTHRIDLEDVPKAYAILDAREEHMMKPFVQTKFSDPPAPGTPALTRF